VTTIWVIVAVVAAVSILMIAGPRK